MKELTRIRDELIENALASYDVGDYGAMREALKLAHMMSEMLNALSRTYNLTGESA